MASGCAYVYRLSNLEGPMLDGSALMSIRFLNFHRPLTNAAGFRCLPCGYNHSGKAFNLLGKTTLNASHMLPYGGEGCQGRPAVFFSTFNP